MVFYENVKGIGATKEECRESYAQALIDAEVPQDIRDKASFRFSMTKNSDGLYEMIPSAACFINGI